MQGDLVSASGDLHRHRVEVTLLIIRVQRDIAHMPLLKGEILDPEVRCEG